jgi:hypothetical protein
MKNRSSKKLTMVLFSFCLPSCSWTTFNMLKLTKEASRRQHPGFLLFTRFMHHYFYFLSQLYAYQKKKNRFNSELTMVVLFSYFSRSRSSTTSSHRWGWTSAARMDKCSANSVDRDNVHKAGMVMNGLPISVYASETLGCATTMSTYG